MKMNTALDIIHSPKENIVLRFHMIQNQNLVVIDVPYEENFTLFFQVAVFYFHDEFTWLKGVGLTTTMVGVSLFNWYKYEKFKKGQINEDGVDSPSFSGDAKYIILDDLEDEDGFLDEDT
uniref:Uncharacterized protein n=2 Tax=Aegilops tauschii subsp. strangulata TaxID=200361 RepID=A0A453QQF4_AEGTS